MRCPMPRAVLCLLYETIFGITCMYMTLETAWLTKLSRFDHECEEDVHEALRLTFRKSKPKWLIIHHLPERFRPRDGLFTRIVATRQTCWWGVDSSQIIFPDVEPSDGVEALTPFRVATPASLREIWFSSLSAVYITNSPGATCLEFLLSRPTLLPLFLTAWFPNPRTVSRAFLHA